MLFLHRVVFSISLSQILKLRFAPIILNPSPNIQPRLHALRNRQSRMQRTLQSPPLPVQIPPKNGIPRNRLKCNPGIQLLIAIHPVAPFLVLQSFQAREVRAAAGAVGLDVDEEGAVDVAGQGRGVCEPVVVVPVLVCGAVALDDERFDQ